MTRLRDIREKFGYTQDFVADSIEVSRVTYIRYENAERQPRTLELLKLAKLYNVSADYLLELTDIPNIYLDTKIDPSPNEQEQAINVAKAALNGEATPAIPANLEEFSKFVRQIVYQALEERDKHTDGQS